MADQVESPHDHDTARLLTLLRSFVEVGRGEKRRLLESETPFLLHPVAEALLRSAARHASEQGESDDAKDYDWHANVLAACREQGVEAVFEAQQEEPEEIPLPNTVREAVRELQALRDEGDEARLDGARLRRQIALCKRILKAASRRDHPTLWGFVNGHLGSVLSLLGALNGDMLVVRSAVQAHLAALETIESGTREWATEQNNLGNALRNFGEMVGDQIALRRAEEAFRAALEVRTRQRSPSDWATTQINLGGALHRLGDLTSDASILRAAEQVYRAVLDVLPLGTELWVMAQAELGGVLTTVGQLTKDVLTLRSAEEVVRATLKECTGEQIVFRAGMQNLLGNALHVLGTLTDDALALRRAEEAYRDALEGERRPIVRAGIQGNLGQVLQRLGDLTGEASALRAAEQAYRKALEAWQASGEEYFRQVAAGGLASLLSRQERHEEAAVVIVAALLRSDAAIMDTARSPEGRMEAIGQVASLYSLLSLCRLRQAEPDAAAALIAAEAGRARLLADALAVDTVSLEDIDDPKVRSRIDAARKRRTALRAQLGLGQTGREAVPRDLRVEERERLQEALRKASETYGALCRKHGLIRASKPLSLSQILGAVPPGGALVLPVLTEREAFVFVVADGTGRPAAIDLPRLDLKAADRHLVDNWFETYNNKYFRVHGDQAAAERWRSQLRSTLAWLWERLLGPIHVHLCDVAKLERNAPVTLLPPGQLGLLPLHAAGPGPDGLRFGEHWTVSYAPSIRTLLTCREVAEQRIDGPISLLAVIDPPSERPLHGARLEAPMLQQRFARAGATILVGEEASLEAVLRRLSDSGCFHASTHGWYDPMQPTRSGLLLAGEPLRVESLQNCRLNAARLVFLSACESGLSDIYRLPNEFIGLPAAFVQAGAASVVGSLWPIGDAASFLLASRFYELWLDADGKERTKPVRALRGAVEWLRLLTFADLKGMFAVERDATGSALLFGATRNALPDDEAPPLPRTEHIRLPLGSDGDRPFADPEHWAAFACTGA